MKRQIETEGEGEREKMQKTDKGGNGRGETKKVLKNKIMRKRKGRGKTGGKGMFF